MQAERRANLELHLAVFLWGFTAILGDLIQLSALVLVWWRVLITPLSLLLLMRSLKSFREMPRRLALQYMGIGVLVALHWLAFYGAIKLANASVALICMAATSFFTAFLEPLFLRQRIKGYEIFWAC
jgi:drug/metabolite transporter (DMT)-like permease